VSVASDIAGALAARLAQITVANGYATDIGLRVFRGKRSLGEEAVPCVTVIEGDDAPQTGGGKLNGAVTIAQRYAIEGHVVCDPDHPNDAAHLVIADLKRAIFAGGRAVGGAPKLGNAREVNYVGRSISSREDGLAIVAASIEIDAVYAEDLRAP
jgi:hypothetical protein